MLEKNKQLSLGLSVIVLLGFILSLVLVVYVPPLTENAALLLENEKINFPLPVRLKIPKINADAAVEYVGLTSTGAMDVPKGPADVAWFNLGTTPGDIGSAVMAGHYGWKNNIPAVFDNLNKLQKGDKIYVENAKGETITFVVREFKTYDQNADASDVFSSNDGKSHLNLITCEGIWNEAKKGRPYRLVVFTDRK